MAKPPRIYTLGHSTRPLEGFLAILSAHGIQLLADVRAFPASRRYPHFNQQPLADALGEAGIAYQHFPDLGGRRKPSPHSQNTAWRHPAFRAYADYMETPAFAAAIGRLEADARARPTAVMCAEALWWKCHRSLIADQLKSRGWHVTHLTSTAPGEDHPYTKAASIVSGSLSYRASPDTLGPLFTP